MPSGSHIRILSEDVANKIAAGEVVERPASVVKELMENALDAGATRIDVTITAGGRRLVSVADNGSGMGRDDALLAPERQATSKLRTAEDLARIGTMGFRGEALPSIASVSRFTLRTRRAQDDAGTEVEILGGRTVAVRDCGAPPGTTVEVRDLFFNVPARRAFLRSYATEQAHVRGMFLVHAIAWPAVAFSLTCDGDPVHRLRPAASLRERLDDLFGAGYMDGFVPIDHAAASVCVTGWAGLPSQTRADTAGQYVFVNGRPSTAPVVQAAIRESYPHLPQGRRPVLFLFLELPPEEVDVNVHPTKREVRFRAVGAVRDAVLAALSKALGGVPGAGPSAASGGAGGPPADRLGGFGPALPPGPVQPTFAPIDERTFAPPRPGGGIPAARGGVPDPATPLPPPPGTQGHGDAETQEPGDAGTPGPSPFHSQLSSSYSTPAPWTKFRLIGSLSSGYALVETDGGYAVVDPAAAHERVLYERLLRAAPEVAESPAQKLLLPQSVALPPVDAQRVRSLLPVFAEMGFDLEDFGGDAFLVRSLPAALSGADARAILEETARALEEAGPRKGRERWREELVAAAASRSAVRTRKPLDARELVPILMELAACRLPYATPGGRPTMVFTSLRDLDRRFGRA